MLKRAHNFVWNCRQIHITIQSSRFSSTQTNAGFSQLGLIAPVLEGLQAHGFTIPTKVQESIIPRLLKKENIVLTASTGSGKTLAYTLPIINNLILEEEAGYVREHQRPRCLILVPTRELATQVLGSVKSIAHHAKVSSCAILGGESHSLQRKMLDRKFDILVGSPGRLVKHINEKNVSMREVEYIVIDEADTMLTQGFGPDIRTILQSVISPRQSSPPSAISHPARPTPRRAPVSRGKGLPQLVMASATLSGAVKSLLEDVQGFRIDLPGYLVHTSNTQRVRNSQPRDTSRVSQSASADEVSRIHLEVVEIEGTHRSLSSVTHVMEDTRGEDKVRVLEGLLMKHHHREWKTMIFCNTVASCRALAYALENMSIDAVSYHGGLSSDLRAANLLSFRDTNSQYQYMVCTDIAARGIDIPEVEHVVMFDFPMNPIDYLHRAGRTGRMDSKGRVSSIVAKRDRVLASAVDTAIKRGLPLDGLSSRKKDYQQGEKLKDMMGVKVIKSHTGSNTRNKLTIRSQSNARIVSDPTRPGIVARQAPKRMVSRTSRKMAHEELAKHSRIGAQLIMKERREQYREKKKQGKGSSRSVFSGRDVRTPKKKGRGRKTPEEQGSRKRR